jgi:hypothetical protein
MTTGTTHDHDPQPDAPPGGYDTPRVRASDAERAATVEVLKDAVAHGLLTPDEGSERMATAFAARHRDELPAVTADLPPLAVPAVATSVGWRHIASSLVAQLRHEVHATREAGVRSRRFLVSVLVALLLLGVLLTLGGLAAHGLFDGHPGQHGFDGPR